MKGYLVFTKMDKILLKIKNLSIAVYKQDSLKNKTLIQKLIDENEDLQILLNNINLTVNKGEYLGIVGESGSGKSLTIKSILGMIDFEPGIVSGNINIKDSEKDIAVLKNKNFSIKTLSKFSRNTYNTYNYESNISAMEFTREFFSSIVEDENQTYIFYNSSDIENKIKLNKISGFNEIEKLKSEYNLVYVKCRIKAPDNTTQINKNQIRFLKEKKIQGRLVSIILQDPISFLYPYWSIERQIKNLQKLNTQNFNENSLDKQLDDLLEEVRLNSKAFRNALPRTISGGQGQRVMIILAALTNPSLLIADEPTTGLDVTIKKIIVDKFKKMRDEKDKVSSMIFISHDINMVRRSTDRMYVVYFGNIVENSTSDRFLSEKNHHPYTEKLIKITSNHYQEGISGGIEDLNVISKITGCKYFTKCHLEFKKDLCKEISPPAIKIDSGEILINEDYTKEWVKCWAFYKAYK